MFGLPYMKDHGMQPRGQLWNGSTGRNLLKIKVRKINTGFNPRGDLDEREPNVGLDYGIRDNTNEECDLNWRDTVPKKQKPYIESDQEKRSRLEMKH